MTDYYVQSMKCSGRSVELTETRVVASSREEAIAKRKRQAPTQKIIGVRTKDDPKKGG